MSTEILEIKFEKKGIFVPLMDKDVFNDTKRMLKLEIKFQK